MYISNTQSMIDNTVLSYLRDRFKGSGPTVNNDMIHTKQLQEKLLARCVVPDGSSLYTAAQFGLIGTSAGLISVQFFYQLAEAGRKVQGDLLTLHGIVIPYGRCSYGRRSNLPPTIFSAHCFAESLDISGRDITISFALDDCRIVASGKEGTAMIWEEGDGLHFECLCPDSLFGHDLRVCVARGEITGAAAVIVVGDRSTTPQGHNVIAKAHLLALSIVPFNPQFDTGTAVKAKKPYCSCASCVHRRAYFRSASVNLVGLANGQLLTTATTTTNNSLIGDAL